MKKLVQDYVLEEEIGSGSFGKVFKGFNIKTNDVVAVKAISKEIFKTSPRLESLIQNEMEVLKLVNNNAHIIKHFKSFKTSNNLYMVYEFCNGGTLHDLIKKKGFLTEKEALNVLEQLFIAFKEMNNHEILHRDLKPQNIFIHDNKIKIGDFGFSKILGQGQQVTTTMLGSPIYMAPQVITGQAYTSKADIWSIGVLLYQMLYGVCPFQSNSIATLILNLKNDHVIFPTTQSVSEKTISLIKKILDKNQFTRISWSELFRYFEKQEKHQVVNCSPKLFRPYSHYIDLADTNNYHNITSIPQNFSFERRSLSNEKNKLNSDLEETRTDSTFGASNGSLSEQLNLSARFELNRQLNNLGSQLSKCIHSQNNSKPNPYLIQILKTQQDKILGSNLAVDIFINDNKEGPLYYYLILSEVKTELQSIKSKILSGFSQIRRILQKQVSLIQKEITIVKQHLNLRGIKYNYMIDIPTFLRTKESSSKIKSDLWIKMLKYFNKTEKFQTLSKNKTFTIPNTRYQ